MRNPERCGRFEIVSDVLIVGVCILIGATTPGRAAEPPAGECDPAEVTEHVREQIRHFGPLSENREYFGFIYRLEGHIASAVTRSNECKSGDRCLTDTAQAAKQIPKGARVLGEWHTHPVLNGSRLLSAEDVRGAHHNRQIRCYAPFYSTPGGDIYSWDVRQTSVPTAMNSRGYMGNRDGRSTLKLAAQEKPGS